MTDAEEYRSLLQQKKGLVFEMLRLSGDVGLKEGTPEQKADRYVEFVAAREPLIAELRALDEKLARFDGQPELLEETAELRQEIKAMGGQIVRLEPNIRRDALSLSAFFQRRIHTIKSQKQEALSRGEYTKGLRYQKNV